MKYILSVAVFCLSLLLLNPSAIADTIHTPVGVADLGSSIYAGKPANLCAEGSLNQQSTPAVTTLRLRVEPLSYDPFGNVDSKSSDVLMEMVITNQVQWLTNVKKREIENFDQHCGTEYLARISYGAAVARVLQVENSEAAKIQGFEVALNSEADLTDFQNKVKVQLAKIQNLGGWGVHTSGFIHGGKFEELSCLS